MSPQELKTKIFLDSGDPKETREVLDMLGFLDGQTTNPSLIAKNPQVQARLAKGEKFSQEEVLNFYRAVVKEVSGLIPQGSVSIEVYADGNTSAGQMLNQGREFFKWIPNAHIKFPTTAEGLKAAEAAVKEGIRVNMTLVFSQEQAAAVYAATRGAGPGGVFVSPFIGRLDDRGENGMDLIANIRKMYQSGDGHVQVLAASVRSLSHFTQSLALGADIITAPLKAIKEWAEAGKPTSPQPSLQEGREGLRPIPFQEINLGKPWQEYNIKHELTDKGIEKFAADWNNLIQR
ncbi:MAG: transaldolase [Patescibacteria group bacterium]|nr:transaldolase [Patescibacteria group bacterium]